MLKESIGPESGYRFWGYPMLKESIGPKSGYRFWGNPMLNQRIAGSSSSPELRRRHAGCSIGGESERTFEMRPVRTRRCAFLSVPRHAGALYVPR